MTAATVPASAAGLATVTPGGTVLDVWYPAPRLGAPDDGKAGTTRIGALDLSGELGPDFGGLSEWPLENVVKVLCFCHPEDDASMWADQ